MTFDHVIVYSSELNGKGNQDTNYSTDVALAIVTYGNGVPSALLAARHLSEQPSISQGGSVVVIDAPLPERHTRWPTQLYHQQFWVLWESSEHSLRRCLQGRARYAIRGPCYHFALRGSARSLLLGNGGSCPDIQPPGEYTYLSLRGFNRSRSRAPSVSI